MSIVRLSIDDDMSIRGKEVNADASLLYAPHLAELTGLLLGLPYLTRQDSRLFS